MAAAPEMHEVCLELINALESELPEDRDTKLEKAKKKATAILAKVTGADLTNDRDQPYDVRFPDKA